MTHLVLDAGPQHVRSTPSIGAGALGVTDGLYDTSLSRTTTSELAPPGELTKGPDMPAVAAAHPLPGEDAPLPKRRGGVVTPDEALGTGRRLVKEHAARRGIEPDLPEALPYSEQSGTTPLLSVRCGRRATWFGHARADLEGRTLSDAVREFVTLYGQNPPGSEITFVMPRTRG